MRRLVTYDHDALLNEMLRRGWRFADLQREVNRQRDEDDLPPLSFDQVRRLVRGEQHSPAVAAAVAKVFGKIESDYRALPTRRSKGPRPAIARK